MTHSFAEGFGRMKLLTQGDEMCLVLAPSDGLKGHTPVPSGYYTLRRTPPRPSPSSIHDPQSSLVHDPPRPSSNYFE